MSARNNSTCPNTTLLEKEFIKNKNKSSFLSIAVIQTIQFSTGRKVNARLNRFHLNLISPDIYNYIDQIVDFMEDNGYQKIEQDHLVTQSDSFVNGLFKIVEANNPAIDAGGLSRQFLTKINENINDENFFNNEEGRITTTIRNKQKLRAVIAILICLYNSGEGAFVSKFKFGHSINIFNQIYPDRDLVSLMEPQIKEFAVKILKEDKRKVRPLTSSHHRMNTYLWLMAEFIDEGFKVQEGTSCSAIVTANTIKMYEGMYEYIFTGADWGDMMEAGEEAGGGEANNNMPLGDKISPENLLILIYRLNRRLSYAGTPLYTAANRTLIDDVRSSILFLKVILSYIVENASPLIFFTKLDELLEPLETNIYLPSDYDGKLESFSYDTHKLWEAIDKYPEEVTFRPIYSKRKLELHIELIEYLKRQTSFLPDEIKENINTVS